jgi:hypothetical protein
MWIVEELLRLFIKQHGKRCLHHLHNYSDADNSIGPCILPYGVNLRDFIYYLVGANKCQKLKLTVELPSVLDALATAV